MSRSKFQLVMAFFVCATLSVLVASVFSGCGGQEGAVIQTTAALDGTPTLPIPYAPSHVMQPGQDWPYVCGNYSSCYDSSGNYAAGVYPNRCPCIVAAPPGCRMQLHWAAPGNRLGRGETRLCTGPSLSGDCIIVQSGTRLDYWWMALGGFEGTWPDGSFTGIRSYQLGPHTQTLLTWLTDGFSPGSINYNISNNPSGTNWTSNDIPLDGSTISGTYRQIYSHPLE